SWPQGITHGCGPNPSPTRSLRPSLSTRKRSPNTRVPCKELRDSRPRMLPRSPRSTSNSWANTSSSPAADPARPVILILSTRSDTHAAAVLRVLAARGADAVLADLSDFPRAATVAMRYDGGASSAELSLADGRRIDLHTCTAIRWRPP